MKKLIALSILATLIAGCDECVTTKNKMASWEKIGTGTFGTFVKTITLKGHEYVVLDGYRKGCIIHSASCSCHQDK